MLKWTLRTPGDSFSCPPSPSLRHRTEFRFCLEDSNKCWYEATVKVAQVKSTSQVTGRADDEEEHDSGTSSVLSGKGFERSGTNGTSSSVFKKLLYGSPVAVVADEPKKKKQQKHVSCRALDPLRIFTGDISDSDTSSAYMKLEKIPVALEPKPQISISTGRLDPRRRPLVDISNGDYSDLRKHLSCLDKRMETSKTHSKASNPLTIYERLKRYRDSCSTNDLGDASKLSVKDFLQNSSSISQRIKVNVEVDRNTISSRSLLSSNQVYESGKMEAFPCPDARGDGPSVTSSATQTPRGFGLRSAKRKRDLKLQRDLQLVRDSRKRHSIADISCSRVPSVQQTAPGTLKPDECPLKIHHVRDSFGGSTLRGDDIVVPFDKSIHFRESNRTCSCKSWGSKISERGRLREPIYECINSSCANNSKRRSRWYLSMNDLRMPLCKTCQESPSKDGDYEVCIYSSPTLLKKTSINSPQSPIYANSLFVPEEAGEMSKGPIEGPTISLQDLHLSATCYFTSKPQHNIHKPVAIKGSRETGVLCRSKDESATENTTSEFLTSSRYPELKTKEGCHSPYERGENFSHFHNKQSFNGGLHKGTERFARCKSESNIYEWAHLHKITGQHLHTSHSQLAINKSGLPPQNFESSLIPQTMKTSNVAVINKQRRKSKSGLKLDANLPIIYEVHSNEEDIQFTTSGSSNGDFSVDDLDKENAVGRNVPTESEKKWQESNSSCSSNQSCENLDSGLSEGINTPLVSPLSDPPSPSSDSVLGEHQSHFNLDVPQYCQENVRYIIENGVHTDYSLDYCRKYENKENCLVKTNGRRRSISGDNIPDISVNKKLELSNLSFDYSAAREWEESLRSFLRGEKNDVAMSDLLHKAVEKNLFGESMNSDNSILFKSSNSCNLPRRHSFASIKDIAMTPQNSSGEETSVWNTSSSILGSHHGLGKSHSLMSLSTWISNELLSCKVKLDNGNSLCTDLNLSSKGFNQSENCSVKDESHAHLIKGSGRQRHSANNSLSLIPENSVESGRGRRGGKEKNKVESLGENVVANQTSGDALEQSFLPSHISDPPVFFSSSGNLKLPVEMRSGINGQERHEDNLVPQLHPLSKHAVEVFQKLNSNERSLEGHEFPLTEKQRLRQEESLFRVQRLLDEQLSSSDDARFETSADWSLEAVADESSVGGLDCSQVSPRSSNSPNSDPSSDSIDNFSVCTLDSELASSVYLGTKLCEKIRKVSEEKMFDKLRQSFRKKERSVPKIGVFMLVDNPLYASPVAKKKAKIITFTPGKRKSFRFRTKQEKDSKQKEEFKENYIERREWYVGNPLYNSPLGNNKYFSSGNKENRKNVALSDNRNGIKYATHSSQNCWIQTNPGYLSPGGHNDIRAYPSRATISTNRAQKPLPLPPQSTKELDETENHYLTPIVRDTRTPPPSPFYVNQPSQPPIVDHQYCTIEDDEADSWVSHSSGSPVAKRHLKFDSIGTAQSNSDNARYEVSHEDEASKRTKRKKPPVTPSRIWRHDPKACHSTPRKHYPSNHKISPSKGPAPFSTRGFRTPRSIKRDNLRKHQTNIESSRYSPTSSPNDYRVGSSPGVSLPPDHVYESVTSLKITKDSQIRTEGTKRPSSDSQRSVKGVSSKQALSLPRRKTKKTTPRHPVTKKYKAREVLLGKGQLKLAVYENFGLLTIHIIEARKLRPLFSPACNPYVKISLVPDSQERTFCRTALHRSSSAPMFDQKFSFDFLQEDLFKRLLISVWSRDTTRRRSEFLGCMSFGVSHILSNGISGWFRLLTEAVGRGKHFAVSLGGTPIDSKGSIRIRNVVTSENTSAIVPIDDEKMETSLPSREESNAKENFPVDNGMNTLAIYSTYQGLTPYTISVNIHRNSRGFGFSVSWTRPPRVEKVEAGKAAEAAGLKTGDYIIFVGRQNVVKLCENDILQIIRECGDHLPLEVYRSGVSKTPETLLAGCARPPPLLPQCALRPSSFRGLETTTLPAVLPKGKKDIEKFDGCTEEENKVQHSDNAENDGKSAVSWTASKAEERQFSLTTKDIAKNLVFGHNITPFVLSKTHRRWIFGSELTTLGRRQQLLKPLWAMLFSDLILLTTINAIGRIRVVCDPIVIANIKKARFKWRGTRGGTFILMESTLKNSDKSRFSGLRASFSLKRQNTFTKSRRETVRTLTFRAPTIQTKILWEALLTYLIQITQSSKSNDNSTTASLETISKRTSHIAVVNIKSNCVKSGNVNENSIFNVYKGNEDRNLESLSTSNKKDGTMEAAEANMSEVTNVCEKDNTDLTKVDISENCFVSDNSLICDKYLEQSTKKAFLPSLNNVRSKVTRTFFGNDILPTRKGIKATKKVQSYVNSLNVVENDEGRSVTPLFEGEDTLEISDFIKKRKEVLDQNVHRDYLTGEEVILNDIVSTTLSLADFTKGEPSMNMNTSPLPNVCNENGVAREVNESDCSTKDKGSPQRNSEGVQSFNFKTEANSESKNDFEAKSILKDEVEDEETYTDRLRVGSMKIIGFSRNDPRKINQRLNLIDGRVGHEEGKRVDNTPRRSEAKSTSTMHSTSLSDEGRVPNDDQLKERIASNKMGEMNAMNSCSEVTNSGLSLRSTSKFVKTQNKGNCDISTPITSLQQRPLCSVEPMMAARLKKERSGMFVSSRLKHFEKVAEEEHERYLECLKARERLLRKKIPIPL